MTRAQLKAFFTRGAKPTAGQFASWIDSFWHKDDDTLPISKIGGLSTTLAGKAANEDLQNEATTRASADEDLQMQIDELTESGGIGYTAEDVANKNIANGYAGLDETGKVSASQLPSYVDDVLEFANFVALPAPGEAGKIYITTDNNNEYRWSGSTYIQIVASPGTTDAVPEGATNKYFTNSRVLNSILTGIGFGTSTAVAATDSILQAFGKLQAQITALFKIPTGGTAGQILAKNSNADGDLHWINAPVDGAQGPAGVGVPTGGTAGQILAKNTNADGDTHWINAPSGGSGGSSEPSGQIKSFRVDYGAVGDGVTDDTAAVANALAANKRIFDKGDFLVTAFDNTNGVTIDGDVRILKQTTYLKQQINSYADKYQRVFGEEYLSSFHKKLLAKSAVKVILSGDSTTAGTGASSNTYHPDILLNQITLNNRINNVTYVNSGIGGQGTPYWLSTSLSADLAQNPDVYILRWGINDSWAGGTPEANATAFLSRLDTGLSTIRSTTGFDYRHLAIIIQSQNPTTDDSNGHQGQIFNELVNSGLRALARKYQCVYQDIYGTFQDSVHGQDYLTAINVSLPNELVHPQDPLYVAMANKTFDVLFPEYFRGDGVVDAGQSGRLFSALPSAYSKGITHEYVESSNGWPINGFLITHHLSNDMYRQELASFDATNNGKLYVRVGWSVSGWQSFYILSPVPTALVYDGTPSGITLSKLPTAFPTGICTDYVSSSDGWPINGMLITHKASIGTVKQTLSSYDTATNEYVRVGWSSWQAWKQVNLT
ncbi:SGNH/GDSL hydrolase family protein [Mucilaginibacter rubeus]|uniref:SGNH/GDSL hydrolase family protein n=1 Tax=Mucilaginibacter rubeus TaxID=2027860 RepID=UPI001668A38A|nr:SGNH/GDSL hydrolase family protein [Mucilaginibacter rubeus]GGB14233.1 hypothetical protein GCM10011500_32770 [Mucilaginibacter rubeus]